MSGDLEVRHNREDDRFESDVDGGVAFVEYIIDGDEITFTHTEVPKEAEGKGIAGNLVASALAYAREAKLRVIPQCAYVASWMKRHREYDDILHPEVRED
ncbi:MAG: N-acetyltransferase [Acidobacteriota bacterium]|nr:N-acetyltransferase [Acidobacteriota bacterium]